MDCLVLLHGFEHPADERTPQPSPGLVCPEDLRSPNFESGIQWWERGLEYGAISTNYSTLASAASGKTGSVHRGEGGLVEGPKVLDWNVPATPGNGMGRYLVTCR
ncbi:hypothetical protein B0H65DRAFT_479599 [Neurospora tetraspora]|uniref:Uncharacterized protein n=1 Tax=Neurospora tetraspora TaxID=94610 RepID=A0AAE0J0I7_9PEZI|nr:hypothetical protein B0H65DRAFT_479599 [Neurospora tetraspora]